MNRTIAFTFALVLVALPCAAQQPQETLSNQEARARFEEGIKLADSNDYERARVKFLQAYALEQRPSILINLAVCEQKTNRLLEAIDHAEQYLHNPRPDPKRAEYVRQLLAELSKSTGQIKIIAPNGLAIVVDGAAKGKTPVDVEIHVMPGKHTVTIGDKTNDVTCNAGETQTVKIEVTDGGTGSPPPTETTRTQWMPPPVGAIVLAGIGIVGLGVGIGLGAASSGQRSDLDTKAMATGGICGTMPTAPACADLKSSRDGTQTTALISTVSYIAGGALIVGGVLWWMLAPRKVVERVPATPVVGAGFIGVSSTLRF